MDGDRPHIPSSIGLLNTIGCSAVQSGEHLPIYIVKREKHQNRLVRPSGGVTWGGAGMRAPRAVLFQVKYTNRMFHVLTRAWGGKMYDFRLERAG